MVSILRLATKTSFKALPTVRINSTLINSSYRYNNYFNKLSSLNLNSRLYSTKKDDESYKSVLDDDILAKAGVDTEEPIKESKKEFEGSEKESDAPKDEFEQTRSRRHNTKSTLDKKKEWYSKLFWYSCLGGTLAFAGYMARDWDKIEESEMYDEEENGLSPGKILTRLRKRVLGVSEVFSEPAFEDLLPPPAPEPYRPPLTLVLELDDLLVHSAWDLKKGWRTAKRPGVDYFLGYLSQYYEIVVFSRSSMAFAENTVAKLDPYHAFISYSLFREVCRSKDGKLIKDLSLMNRDLAKLVIVDPDPDCYSMQPENAIPIEKWTGAKDDSLIKLIPFLEYLATQRVKDVRPVLSSFKDKNKIPEEFAERERKLREQWEKDQQKKGKDDIFGALLGIPAAMRGQKKMPLDAIREQGQKNYLHMHNYLKENGEKLLKEEQEKTKEMMADQKLTLGKIVNEGMPTAEDIARAAAERQAQEAASTGLKTQNN